MATKLYVGNFPYDTTDQDLRTLFADSGQVDNVNMVNAPIVAKERDIELSEVKHDLSKLRMFRDFITHDSGNLDVAIARKK